MKRYKLWEHFVAGEMYKRFFLLPNCAIIDTKKGARDMDVCACGSNIPSEYCHKLKSGSLVANLWHKLIMLDAGLSAYDGFCKVGCHECCKEYFYVSAAEYFLMKNHLLCFNPSFFEEAKQIGKEQLSLLAKSHTRELAKLIAPSDVVQSCALLDRNTGYCSAYPARTLICRLYGSSSLFAYCDEIRGHIMSMAKIPYNMDLTAGVDHFVGSNGKTVFQRPYPLLFWLAFDDAYTNMYDIAISNPMTDYIAMLEEDI